MKRKKIEIIMSYIFGLIFALQVLYLMVYSYSMRKEPIGAAGLFITILAFELLLYYFYIYTRFKSLINDFISCVKSLKSKESVTVLSSGYTQINEALMDLREAFLKEVDIEKTKKEITYKCLTIYNKAELLRSIMPLIVEVAKADAICYYARNAITDRLEIVESLGFGGKLYSRLDAKVGEGLEGMCCKGKITHVISDDDGSDNFKADNIYFKMKYKSVMAVPVCTDDECVGVLTLAYLKHINKESIECAEEIARYIGAAHKNVMEYEVRQRQKDEFDLQGKLLKDMAFELENAKKEIDRLENKN